MKRIYIFILMTLAIGVSSCHFLDGSSNYTPKVTAYNFQNTKGDTLYVHYNSKLETYSLDTMSVGDTVLFSVLYHSYENNLVSMGIDYDKNALDLKAFIGDTLASVLKPSSDTTLVRLDMQTGYNTVGMPVRMIPLKEGASKLTFSVTSDAESKNLVSNNSTISLELYAE